MKRNNPAKHNNQNKFIKPPPDPPLELLLAGADETAAAELELDATELATELLELDATALDIELLELELITELDELELAGSSAGGVPV